jgi:hypothetical protein
VTFWTNNVFLGTNIVVGGVASTNTASLPAGNTTVEARYTGDVNFVGVTNSITQVVNVTACSSAASPVTISNIFGTTLTYGGGSGARFILFQSAAVTGSPWTTTGLTRACPQSGLFLG